MDTSKTLNAYMEELASKSPTPGGGNVAALCGVVAASLGAMVCNLTIGKKKYAEVEEEITTAKAKLVSFKDKFVQLGKEDNKAFDKVMDAFKLPKETDEEKEARREAIEKATFDAAVVPSQVLEECNELLPILMQVADKGNKNSVSDAAVGIALTATAAEGAFLNVLINCSGMSNQTMANEFLKKNEFIYNSILHQKTEKMQAVINGMRNQ